MIHSSKKIGYFIVSESYDRVKECLNVIEAIDHKKIASSSKERKYYILGRLLFEETINISKLDLWGNNASMTCMPLDLILPLVDLLMIL